MTQDIVKVQSQMLDVVFSCHSADVAPVCYYIPHPPEHICINWCSYISDPARRAVGTEGGADRLSRVCTSRSPEA